jgi:hypothetical protein
MKNDEDIAMLLQNQADLNNGRLGPQRPYFKKTKSHFQDIMKSGLGN